MTHQLESFLRTELAPKTSPMPQGTSKTLYRLYTEDINRVELVEMVKRYFKGATITQGVGVDSKTQLADEASLTIEIVSSLDDALFRILSLAEDIRRHNQQISVLVTQQPITTFEVTRGGGVA